MGLEDKLLSNGTNMEMANTKSQPDLEGKLNYQGNNHQEKREGFFSALKKFSLWDWTKIVVTNTVGAIFSGGLFGFGALNVAATTASFVTANYLVNRKKGFTKNSMQTEFVLGGVYTPMIYKLFDIINVFTPNPLAWMAAYALSLYPFTVATHASKYMIEKYSPSTFLSKGILGGEILSQDLPHIWKDAKTDSVKSSALAALFLTLPVAGVHYYLPEDYLIAALYPIRTTYRYILEAQEQKKKIKSNIAQNYIPAPQRMPIPSYGMPHVQAA
ncbi:MAG: hypothetical protein QS98_C0008G0047 [archaeon GW2011_AR3]|nr:MAG: hypothetical protein QS98_C0008G0047 [archaeon GW2011_AR3]